MLGVSWKTHRRQRDPAGPGGCQRRCGSERVRGPERRPFGQEDDGNAVPPRGERRQPASVPILLDAPIRYPLFLSSSPKLLVSSRLSIENRRHFLGSQPASA